MIQDFNNILIRDCTKEDMEAVSVLEKEAFGKQAWTAEQLKDAFLRNDTLYVVAETDGKVIGVCGVQNICGDGEITNVSVNPDFRNCKVAGHMLDYLIENGKKMGISAYTLEVRAGNIPAIKLYENAGFVSEGVRPGFYDNPKEDAVIYWLRF
ncbi:MAG: ribosomal protein S18-alanine N-acetyltransferase [Butyrivibrio sp.]|nr:ribosomal protein S18-alanine N-acetyltransferase [Butyrivibrio sp.]